MKIRLLLLISAIMMSLAEILAFDLNVSEPGTFKDLLLDTDTDISTLHITGTLNAADVEYLTGNTGKITQVKHLDITGLSLVESETEPYRKVTIFSEAGGGVFARFFYSHNQRIEYKSSVGGLGMPVLTYFIYGDDLAGLLADTEFEKVTLPAKDNRIADYICFHNYQLKEVVLPDYAEEIGESCFEDCVSLEIANMPSALKKIGNNAYYRTSLASAELPACTESIGECAFWRAEKLASINLENIKEIGREAFKACALTAVNAVNAETIGREAFMDCPISSLTLSDRLREIPDRAFYLESFSVSDKSNLTELNLPDGLESIGAYAFARTKLSKVEIPASVTFIGDRAFMETPWDRTLNTSAVDGVVYLGNVAYKAVNKPQEIVFRDGTVSVAANFDMSSVRSFTLPSSAESLYAAGGYYENLESATLNEGLRIIGDNVFYNSPKLTSIDIPSTVEYIGDNAFYMAGITSIKLPEGLKEIKSDGQDEFNSTFGKTKLISLTLPVSLEKIGRNAFVDCQSLSTVRLDSRKLDYIDGTNNWGHPFFRCNIEKAIIGAQVEKIPAELFRAGASLARVEFVDSDVPLEIGDYAICGNEAKVNGSIDRVISLGENALSGLEFPFGTRLTLPNVKNLGANALYEVGGVTEIDLHEGIENIIAYNAVCSYMPHLRKVNFDIPNLRREPYPGSDFMQPLIQVRYDCPLDSLTIGKNVETIAESLFDNVPINTVVFAPRPQTRAASSLSIGRDAFNFNQHLYSLEFPAELSALGENAFNGCSQLTTVYFHGSEAPATGANAIEWSATVYVPAEAEKEYRAAISGNNIVPYRIESVMLDKSVLNLKEGSADYLIARIEPAECSEMGIEWTSSDPTVASVSPRGDVAGLAPGKTVITATIALAPEFKAECLVTVFDPNSVESVESAADAPVEAYYTLDGVRIERPSAPGVYVAIHADGTKSKVMIK